MVEFTFIIKYYFFNQVFTPRALLNIVGTAVFLLFAHNSLADFYRVGRLMVYTFYTSCSFFLRESKVMKIGGKVVLSFFYNPEVIRSKLVKALLRN